MNMDELKQLLLEQIRSRPDISSIHPLFSEEMIINETMPDTAQLVSFTYRCVHTFAVTDFGRFYGYRKGLTFRGQASLQEDLISNLSMTPIQIFYSLHVNADLESAGNYGKEYYLKADSIFSTIVEAVHEKSGEGPPEFCQFETIFLDDIQEHHDGGTRYRIQYLFDLDGFSMYDKTATYEGEVVIDATGELVSLNLETVRVGIGR